MSECVPSILLLGNVFAHVLRDQYKVRVVVVRQVINRNCLHTQAPHLAFNAKANAKAALFDNYHVLCIM